MKLLTEVVLPCPWQEGFAPCLSAYRLARRAAVSALSVLRRERAAILATVLDEEDSEALDEVRARYNWNETSVAFYHMRLVMAREYFDYVRSVTDPDSHDPSGPVASGASSARAGVR